MSLLRALLWLLFVAALPGAPAAAQEADAYVDVSIAVFDTHQPEDGQQTDREDLHPEVREAEARYLPAYLRARLQESGVWGAVRVLPGMDPGAELMISGTILHSDGARLELALEAVDSAGRRWLSRTYAGTAQPAVSLLHGDAGPDVFDSLYSAIGTDLETALSRLDEEAVLRLHHLAFLRYGAALLPEAFETYLERDEEGYSYTRLPAADDPMRRRIAEIRAHEFLFIDVVDEQFSRYAAGIRPVYDLWRDYRREQMAEAAGFAGRRMERFPQGSYRDLRQRYDAYRWAKMQEQYLGELRAGFGNEVADTTIDLEDRLYRLSGTIEQQYAQWRAILLELLEIEQGP